MVKGSVGSAHPTVGVLEGDADPTLGLVQIPATARSGGGGSLGDTWALFCGAGDVGYRGSGLRNFYC